MGDNHHIQIGGDAAGNTIISGDGNVVIIQATRSVELEQQPIAPVIGPNPYQGLSAFQEKDTDYFFGRERLTNRLWEVFRDLHESQPDKQLPLRVLPILGPSGSGKSSLVRAGLIPELARRPLPGLRTPRVAVFTPGDHPLEALAAILARIATNDITPVAKSREFAGELQQPNAQGEYDGLRRIAEVLPDITVSPLIILVDQFEEIYSLCDDARERDAFVNNLLHAAASRAGRVSVVLTLRSDFLGQTQRHSALNHAIAARGVIVPAMSDEELRLAIAQPASRAGYPLDAATVDLLVSETEGREGALPLLQFALTRIWEGMAEGVEPAITLQRIDGVGGALAGEAQRIYDSLDEVDQAIARRAFLSMVRLGEGTRDTRRRSTVSDIVARGESADHVEEVLRLFSRPGARLITLSANPDGTNTAEVTHEALFEHWGALQEWLDKSRDDLRFHRRLAEAALHWDTQGRPDGSLWRSPDLDLLQDFHTRSGRDMTELQMEFFQTAIRKERHARWLKFTALVGLTLLVVVAAYVANELRISAKEAAISAMRQLAARARNNQDYQLDRALLLSLEAYRIAKLHNLEATGMPEARSSLLQVLQSNPHLMHYIRGHTGRVQSVAFSRDGHMLASGSFDGTITLWDIATHKLRRPPLTGHTAEVYSVAFSPDGHTLASGSEDGSIILWEVATGRQLDQLRRHTGRVHSVAFSLNGEMLASGGTDKTIILWDIATRQPIGIPLAGHTELVKSVVFSPDGHTLASGDDDNNIILWDTANGKPRGPTLEGHTSWIMSMAFSPDGVKLASGSGDSTIILWDVHKHERSATLRAHPGWVLSVAFSPDGQTLASGGQEGSIIVWDVATLKARRQLRGHTADVTSVAFSRDGLLASGGDDNTIILWDVADHQRLGKPIVSLNNIVTSVAFSPDGQTLASNGQDNTIILRSITAREPLTSPLRGHDKLVRSVAFSPLDGRTLASGSEDGSIILWEVATGRRLDRFHDHTSVVLSIAFSPDGHTLASGSEDGSIILWEVATGRRLDRLRGHRSSVPSVAFSPDGKWLATGSWDHTAQRWEVANTRKVLKPINPKLNKVHAVTFSPDGNILAAGSFLRTITLWDTVTGQPLDPPLTGHTAEVYSVAFSPQDGRTLASGSKDTTIILWDVATRQAIGLLAGHAKKVIGVVFSPDGKKLASGSHDGTIILWDVDFGSWVARACRIANRNLTQAEWHQFIGQGIPYKCTCPDLPPGEGVLLDACVATY